MKRVILYLLMTCAMAFFLAGCGDTAHYEEQAALTILYTNDVHCGIDDNIGYAGLSAYCRKLQEQGGTVLLVDNGDAIQGGDLGMLTKGEAIVELMNAVGYDIATIGNHEFDYGVSRLLELREKADYPCVCCNLRNLETGELVFEPYRILEAAGLKIAFVGVVTPTSLVSSVPSYFMNNDGEYIYDFSQADEGRQLYAEVQKAVDAARGEGADICILLSHLGINAEDSVYTSNALIANTSGIDVVLDGHSHSVVPSEEVLNKEGKKVLYSQTGTKLENIGQLTIQKDGSMSCRLIDHYEEKDEEITSLIAKQKSEFEKILNEKVGHSAYDLSISDEKGNRIVRNAESNLADLAADSLRAHTGAEVSFINGGNVRFDIPAGDISFESILNVHPFGSEIVMAKVTGQNIADALEFGARNEPEEFGGFIQVSGLTYTIDMSVPSGVVINDEGMMTGVEGERRVRDIMINGEPLEADRVYRAAGSNYFFLEGGDGNTAFKGCELIPTEQKTDAEVLAWYIREELGGEIPEEYADRYGQGRITLVG